MKVKKMLLLSVLIVNLLIVIGVFNVHGRGNNQKELPAEALMVAKSRLNEFVDLLIKEGEEVNVSKEEFISGCRLNYLYKVVNVNWLSYRKKGIMKLLCPPFGCKECLGIIVNYRGESIGSVEVAKNRNGEWTIFGYDIYDKVKRNSVDSLFAGYPNNKGYKIYKQRHGDVYFIANSKKKIIDIVSFASEEHEGLIHHEPSSFMLEMKKKLQEHMKKHDFPGADMSSE